jgi:hypothetical protein
MVYSGIFGIVWIKFLLREKGQTATTYLSNIHKELSLANWIYFNCNQNEFEQLKLSHDRQYGKEGI